VVSETRHLSINLGIGMRGKREREREKRGKGRECAGNWLTRERRGRLSNRVKCLRGVVERHKEVIALNLTWWRKYKTYKGGLGRV
jgi:hypothetical protein